MAGSLAKGNLGVLHIRPLPTTFTRHTMSSDSGLHGYANKMLQFMGCGVAVQQTHDGRSRHHLFDTQDAVTRAADRHGEEASIPVVHPAKLGTLMLDLAVAGSAVQFVAAAAPYHFAQRPGVGSQNRALGGSHRFLQHTVALRRGAGSWQLPERDPVFRQRGTQLDGATAGSGWIGVADTAGDARSREPAS